MLEEGYDWDPVLSWVDLAMVQELHIKVTPSNHPRFWVCICAALKTLLEERLKNGCPKLRIELRDTEFSVMVPFRSRHIAPLPTGVGLPLADFTGYEATLEVFEQVARKAPACEILLPHWMEHHVDIGRVFKLWKKDIGADVSFVLVWSDDDLEEESDIESVEL